MFLTTAVKNHSRPANFESFSGFKVRTFEDRNVHLMLQILVPTIIIMMIMMIVMMTMMMIGDDANIFLRGYKTCNKKYY